jgi:hypothetical protein
MRPPDGAWVTPRRRVRKQLDVAGVHRPCAVSATGVDAADLAARAVPAQDGRARRPDEPLPSRSHRSWRCAHQQHRARPAHGYRWHPRASRDRFSARGRSVPLRRGSTLKGICSTPSMSARSTAGDGRRRVVDGHFWRHPSDDSGQASTHTKIKVWRRASILVSRPKPSLRRPRLSRDRDANAARRGGSRATRSAEQVSPYS